MARGKKWRDGHIASVTKVTKENKINNASRKRFKRDKTSLTEHELDDELDSYYGGDWFRQSTRD